MSRKSGGPATALDVSHSTGELWVDSSRFWADSDVRPGSKLHRHIYISSANCGLIIASVFLDQVIKVATRRKN